ncbi:ABC transporter permease subunit [Paenibacillus sp. RUD330]|uniref:ABC transporter permease n=1 Tax=Paenibacillus sp. RUD330 TaxID=2023772 RepID=UPI001F0D1B74|nr:ABC transporter permease subunit [Paenibacillus sp. RUD330]
MLLPGLLYFIIYKYIPMAGNVIAFQNFKPLIGFVESEWVGFKHFEKLFQDREVIRVIWNTLYLSFLQIMFSFPIAIVLSLMLNEVRNGKVKRVVQSIVYLPHFLSWVVVIGLVTSFLKSDGIVNELFAGLGLKTVPFMQNPDWFMPLVVLEVIWKESGFSTIIFLAALSAVNYELYEAAVVDGASRIRRLWHITLPAIRGTIVILLLLRLGNVLDVGFEQIYLMLNPFNKDVGNVLDTYVYLKGIQQSDFSFATAVGLFKSVVGFVLIVGANRLVKRMTGDSIF